MLHKVWIESLGCTKNTVDSEVMLGLLVARGLPLAESPEQADLIIVNTCGFIASATEESIEAILEMVTYKKSGSCKGIIVAGCLYQRYREKLSSEFPEVDAFIGCNEIGKIVEAYQAIQGEKKYYTIGASEFLYDHNTPRVLLNGRASTYVKIAEGCDNRCTYCTIPSIRGRYRSRTIESVVREVRNLIKKGAKEINLLAQDTTYFGQAEGREEGLTALLRELDNIRAKKWLRLMYAHPGRITNAVARTIEDSRSICHYVDMPIQHISDEILRAMGRSGTSGDIRRAIHVLRSEVSDVALRTTVMVGFPGETDREFEQLLDFVRETKFERLGVFTYSREPGTPAAQYRKQVPARVKQERHEILMREQMLISHSLNETLVGKKMEVLIEGTDEEDPAIAIGRTYRDAPEVDGIVRVLYKKRPALNSFQQVIITAAHDYDLEGKLL
ncbi:MAG: 30S ribosomal protein S12 methylthiotransferase RimO [Candidatus Abyssobacteria bacterium SURF_5]|uniref:Ribosomal protein uS12 methylthiotransferase RimO n=1 Tax=Abyssobacteria bacterium (strain SURF_5) TaxID=2093360 RepID=A0A3A4NEA1_ABYX5|nr:MAG: 30S ribosomal protein S12 methylthiotransferase RimO [Candidatus Abyssubacteria bacterium SURF_5]